MMTKINTTGLYTDLEPLHLLVQKRISLANQDDWRGVEAARLEIKALKSKMTRLERKAVKNTELISLNDLLSGDYDAHIKKLVWFTKTGQHISLDTWLEVAFPLPDEDINDWLDKQGISTDMWRVDNATVTIVPNTIADARRARDVLGITVSETVHARYVRMFADCEEKRTWRRFVTDIHNVFVIKESIS